MKNKLLLIILLILVIPAFSSIWRSGYFPMHDDMQAMRLLQMDKCLKDGQIPCRWVPDMGYGYGYPQFNYYAPFPYYLMEGFHLLGFSYLDSVKAFLITTVLISAVGMYLLAKVFWGPFGGFLSALFYVYLPYRATDMYVRGAVGELAAFSILPFVFLFTYKVLKRQKRAILGLTLALSTLFTSHNITTIMMMPFLVLWIGYFFTKQSTKSSLTKTAKNLFLSFLWGLGMASFFILPAWFERNLVHINSLISGYFNYVSHFVGIKTLLFSSYWNYGYSEAGAFDEINLSVGLLHLLFAFVGLLGLWLSKKLEKFKLAAVLMMAFFVALFMIHPKSIFLWQHLPLLKFFQFPWRFLIIAGFFLSLVSGSVIFIVRKEKSLKNIAIVLIALLLIFYSSYFRPKTWVNIIDEGKFSGDLWRLQQTVSLVDYLPIFAKKAPDNPAPERPIFNGVVIEGERGTNWQKWKLKVNEQASVVLPIFYFPNWRVFIDGKETKITVSEDIGLVSFKLNEGEHEIKAELENTPIRNFSNLITLGSILAIPVYLRRRK